LEKQMNRIDRTRARDAVFIDWPPFTRRLRAPK
jgi:hypothetical protein